MTDDKEGLTFTDYTWEIKPGAKPHWSPMVGWTYPDTEARRIQTPHLVPNRMWVVNALYFGQPVGVEHEELTLLEYTTEDGARRRFYTCDKPFGLVSISVTDAFVSQDTVDHDAQRRLTYARQVHKGELGQGVRIPKLDYVRQPLPSHRGQHMSARERRRGQRGWIKLWDLGEVFPGVGYSTTKQVELVLDYWQFSGHRNYGWYQNDQNGGQLVDVAWGSSLDIKLGTAEFKSLTREQFREECSDTSKVWVRRGFAFTLLRLQALGYKLKTTQLA